MTIRKYIIVVENEAKGETHEIEISPATLRDAFQYDPRAIWLYIDAYLLAQKECK